MDIVLHTEAAFERRAGLLHKMFQCLLVSKCLLQKEASWVKKDQQSKHVYSSEMFNGVN